MINFRNSHFVTSLADPATPRANPLPEVLLVGRSNVGKSSLINALTDQKGLAKTSGKPGHTRLLNLFNIDSQFYLVDAPGYGYTRGGAKYERTFGPLMDGYFHADPPLVGVLWLLDARRDLTADDYDFFSFLQTTKIAYKIVLTKFDKLNQSEKAAASKRMKNLLALTDDARFIPFSINQPALVRGLREAIYPW